MRKSSIVWSTAYLASAFAVEAGYLFLPGRVLIWSLLKAAAFLFLFLRLFSGREQPGRPRLSLSLAAMLLYAAADLLISVNLVAGGALYAFGHLVLIRAMRLKRPLAKAGLVLWVSGALLICILVPVLFRSRFLLGCGIALYGIILIGVPVFAVPFSRFLRSGTLLFLLSDLFLAVQLIFPRLRGFQIAGIILFYLSLLLISESVRRREI